VTICVKIRPAATKAGARAASRPFHRSNVPAAECPTNCDRPRDRFPAGRLQWTPGNKTKRTGAIADVSANETVRIYYQDQRESELPMKVVPRLVARQWKNAGRGFFIAHGTAFRLIERRPFGEIFAPPARPFEFDHSSTITLSEMLANVGITSNDPGDIEATAIAHRVVRARVKIALYRFIYDHQAVLVRR
jgi:hypothetical protein